MAQTLLEYAKGAKDDMLAGVIKTFAINSPILRSLPFRTVQGGALQYNVENTLPGMAFRNINAAYNESVSVWLPQIEKVKIMGGDMDTDKALIRRFGESRRLSDIEAQARAQALAFDKYFFDGDESSDPKQFDGMNKRLTGNQLLYTDHAGSAGANIDENCIDILIDALDVKPDLLVMGKAVYRQVKNLFKGNTLITLQPTEWGFSVPAYDGIPIGVVDKDHLGNVILAMDETVGSTSGTCGSIYAFKFDPDRYVCGIQSAPPEGKDLGEIDTKPVLRYRLDWDCGIAMFHPRCAARLAGITAASGIA